VVEVGANIGAHTVWFAQTTASNGGAVIAFEPQRIVFQTLCANLALNNIRNVIAYQSACGETSGVIRVPVLDPNLPNNFGGLELGGDHDAPGDLVPVVRLDDMSIRRCRLMKDDVEGMELGVLKGARETILRCAPVLYVENDRKDKSDELVRFITSLGYELYWHRPFLFSPHNFAGKAENVFPNVVSVNMLCVPKGTKVSALPPVETLARPT
jgi:FkbM family methyltransferase